MIEIKQATHLHDIDVSFWAAVNKVGTLSNREKRNLALFFETYHMDPKMMGVWLGHEGTHLVSMLVAFPPDMVSQAAFVLLAYNDPRHIGARQHMQMSLERWARELGAVSIDMVTQRNTDAWERAYGYKVHGTHMVKDIRDGK